MTDPIRPRILIDPPDGPTILAARHLDAAEGRVQVGTTVDAATRSAITTVLRYVGKAHNSPASATDGGTQAELDRLTAELADYDKRAEQQKQRAERAEAKLRQHAENESADAAAGSYANGNEHAIAHPQPWLHIEFTSPDPTTANTSALSLRDHLAAEFDGVSMRISSNAVETEGARHGRRLAVDGELDDTGLTEADIDHMMATGIPVRIVTAPLTWATARHFSEPDEDPAAVQARFEAGEKETTAPAAPRFTYRPVTPEMERAATARAVQAAADSERSAAWFAATGGVIGAPSCSPGVEETEPNNPPGSTREQLPADVLAAIRPGPYLSTACEAADLLADAIPDRLDLADGLARHAERLHARCRINNKFTGALCVCGCHAPPAPRDPCPHCESSPARIPRDRMRQHIAEQHPEVGAGA